MFLQHLAVKGHSSFFYLLNSDITGGVVHNYAFSCIHRHIRCRQRKCAWNLDAKDYGLGNAVDSSVITYFNPLMHTAVFRVYAEELSYVRQHPLTLRRYMWKLEY